MSETGSICLFCIVIQQMINVGHLMERFSPRANA